MLMRKRIRRRSRRRSPAIRRFASKNLASARLDARQQIAPGPEIAIGGRHDPAEKAADRMAASVMSRAAPEAVLHRKCAACEHEDRGKLRRDARAGGVAMGAKSVPASASAARAVSALGPGRPLSGAEKSFFEPRFERDFSTVRIHQGGAADRAARAVDAEAFALDDRIVFAGDRTPADRGLMAHELAHVVQDRPGLHRSVRPNSRCANNAHGAPNDALAALAAADGSAQALATGAHNLLQFAAVTLELTGSDAGNVVASFRRWFDGPRQLANGRFQSRFRTATFATEGAALAHEMRTVGTHFGRLAAWFGGAIRYVCSGNARFTIPGCAPGRCQANTLAVTCPGGPRVVHICPEFWDPGLSVSARASVLVHEAGHVRLGWTGHGTGWRGRGRNPACYGSFLREIFGITGLSTQCSPIVVLPPITFTAPAAGGAPGPGSAPGAPGAGGGDGE